MTFELAGLYPDSARAEPELPKQVYLRLFETGHGYRLSVVDKSGNVVTAGNILSFVSTSAGTLKLQRAEFISKQLGDVFALTDNRSVELF